VSDIEEDPANNDTEQDDPTDQIRRMLGRLALSGAEVEVSE
jgi:hypothetical protein